ncbi:hypothetical protein LS684_15190 [Cytobacillus spongiae]|uniref:hypothetical protein n=1 Tax=Cytobacillus spongiae TaxID=2901381 RepID=UPI001F48BD9F|nr:hypothetical protein [Cytobacillus spongiae]UII54994.1 hypothetical protein LS684_15190 [Cytobacillus spongiae]
MSPFIGLYKKEMKISRNTDLMVIGFMLLAEIIGYSLSTYYQNPIIFAIISLGLIFAHIFFIPAYLLTSLNIEGQTQLWLHNPTSGVKLFLAKIAASFTVFILSLLATLLIGGYAISQALSLSELNTLKVDLYTSLPLSGIGIALSSIYLGVWILFYWALYHSIKVIPSIKGFRWLIIIGIWLLFNIIGNYLSRLSFIDKLKAFGAFKFDRTNNSITVKAENSSFELGGVFFNLSLGNALLYMVVITIVFYAAVWLLERKVEV